MNQFRPASDPASSASADPAAGPALRPAQFDFRADGTPRSTDYDDVYTSDAGAAGQARHVFLGGNGLPARWGGRERFVIVETGFGLGNNFLATLAAWRADEQRCARLWFVSFEAHPLPAAVLRRMHAAGGATPSMPGATDATDADADLAALSAQWPPAVAGLHRLEFAGGAVQLLLAFGDAATLAPRLTLTADAFYLDGFSPDRNPRMWSAQLFRALGRLAAPDATAATWSYARAVRDALAAAGFDAQRAPGFGSKRDMTIATRAVSPRGRRTIAALATPDAAPRAASSTTGAGDDVQAVAPATVPATRRHDPARRPPATALVIGAGLAGCAVAARLAARGVAVTLIDAGPAPATLTSGNPAGALQPLIARDDSRQARFTRAGYLDALRELRRLGALGLDVGGERAGLLHLAQDGAEADAMRAMLDQLALPPDYVQWLDRDAAAARARGPVRGGMPLPPEAGAIAGGWWFPDGGWLAPARYCGALLAAADPDGRRIEPRFGVSVAALASTDSGWQALDAAGHFIARAQIVVIATGAAAAPLPPDAIADWPVTRIAGQLDLLPVWAPAPAVPVTGDGYVLPALAAGVLVGATYELDEGRVDAVAAHGELSAAASAENRARYLRLLDLPPDENASAAAPAARATGATGATGASTAAANPPRPAVLPPPGTRFPGRSGIRAVVADRLPLVGAIGQPLPADARTCSFEDWPRLPGLYAATGFASRGITWAHLAGETVAALACGDPAPIETDLLDAIDPVRFALRSWRRAH